MNPLRMIASMFAEMARRNPAVDAFLRKALEGDDGPFAKQLRDVMDPPSTG